MNLKKLGFKFTKSGGQGDILTGVRMFRKPASMM